MNRRLQAMLNRQNAIVQRMEEINEAAHTDDREFTSEENKEYLELEGELNSLTSSIKREETLAERQRTLIPGGGPTPLEQRQQQARPKFASMGEQFGAIMRAGMPGGHVDKRLIEIGAYGSGANEQNPADGGFLLQPEYATDLLKLAFDTGQFARLVRRRPIGPNANQLKINALKDYDRRAGARYGGIQTYWVEEGGQKTPSQPRLRQFVLTLKKLVGLFYATDELLADATALEAIAKDAFTEEFGFVIDDVIYRGLGGGQPLGFINSNALLTIAKETGQAASTVLFLNVLKMYAAFWTRSKGSTSARWLATPQVLPLLMQMTLGGTSTVYGAPVFLPPNNAEGRPLATLMGIPILENEHSAALSLAGDLSLVDFDQYLMIDKQGTSPDAPMMASSIHVRFIYDETTFRFVYRCDGQPMWEQPLIQAQDTTNKMSPFVALGAR
jgi:HK97 family phage major capsid protein